MVDGARAVISKWTPIIASEGMLLHRRGRESRRSEAAGCTSLATGTGASVTACTGTRPVRGPQPSASGCPRAAKELPFTPEDVRRRGIWRLNAYTRSRLLGSRLRTRAPATHHPARRIYCRSTPRILSRCCTCKMHCSSAGAEGQEGAEPLAHEPLVVWFESRELSVSSSCARAVRFIKGFRAGCVPLSFTG